MSCQMLVCNRCGSRCLGRLPILCDRRQPCTGHVCVFARLQIMVQRAQSWNFYCDVHNVVRGRNNTMALLVRVELLSECIWLAVHVSAVHVFARHVQLHCCRRTRKQPQQFAVEKGTLLWWLATARHHHAIRQDQPASTAQHSKLNRTRLWLAETVGSSQHQLALTRPPCDEFMLVSATALISSIEFHSTRGWLAVWLLLRQVITHSCTAPGSVDGYLSTDS